MQYSDDGWGSPVKTEVGRYDEISMNNNYESEKIVQKETPILRTHNPPQFQEPFLPPVQTADIVQQVVLNRSSCFSVKPATPSAFVRSAAPASTFVKPTTSTAFVRPASPASAFKRAAPAFERPAPGFERPVPDNLSPQMQNVVEQLPIPPENKIDSSVTPETSPAVSRPVLPEKSAPVPAVDQRKQSKPSISIEDPAVFLNYRYAAALANFGEELQKIFADFKDFLESK